MKAGLVRNASLIQRVMAATLALVLIVLPFVTTDLQLRRLSGLIVLVLAVAGVNLLTGYTGLISLGHGVFVGVGAFAMANLVEAGVPLWLGLVIATMIAGATGVVIGLPALRVRGLYLALITFGVALAFAPLARRMGSLTGGVTGKPVDVVFLPPAWLGLGAHVQVWRYGVCLFVVGLWFVLMANLVGSRPGRAMRAIRDDEAAASLFGVNVAATKAAVLGVSAAMTGTAGALQVMLSPYVSHSQFDVFLSLRLYAAAVIGGLGTLFGAVVGVVALIAVPAINAAVGLVDSDAIVFGFGLILVTYLGSRRSGG